MTRVIMSRVLYDQHRPAHVDSNMNVCKGHKIKFLLERQKFLHIFLKSRTRGDNWEYCFKFHKNNNFSSQITKEICVLLANFFSSIPLGCLQLTGIIL